MSEPGYPPIKIRPDKLCVLSDSISFLSHTVKNGFLQPDEEKLKKVREWERPQTLKQLQSFVGFVSYLREFIPHAATKLKPFTDLINVAPAVLGQYWKPKHDKAFSELQNITRNLPSLKIIESGPDSGTIHLYHDSSSEAFGGIISQEVKTEDGKTKEFPLHIFSRLHTGSEISYSIPEAELQSLAVLIHKYRHHLIGRRFVIHSDSSVVYYALRNLMLQHPTYSKTVKRVAVLLEGLSFTVKHISSSKNPADWPTRLQFKQSSEIKISESQKEMKLPNIVAGVIQPRENEQYVEELPDFKLEEV